MNKHFVIFSAVLLCVVTAIPLAVEPSINTEASINNEGSNAIEESKYRLPRNTAPREYMIELDPKINGEELTFNGRGVYTFEVLESTRTITLHKSSRIEIDKESIDIFAGEKHPPRATSIDWDPHNEFYDINFERELEPRNYTVNINWSGRQSVFSGFERIKYYDDDGNTKYFTIMISKPSNARKIFPCWDEPGFKAKFRMSVKHDPNQTALSNMPAISHRKLRDGNIMTEFKTSPNMATYAVCLVITDNYESIERFEGEGKFYALKKDIDFLKYPLDISQKLKELMGIYTRLPYSLPKLDQIIVPNIYDQKTMENWGLLGYPLSSIKFINTSLVPNVEDRDNILLEISHQIAYQWFGNLVTPTWWNDAWLTESFATYYAFKILEGADQNDSIMGRFAIETLNEESFDAESVFGKPLPIKWMPLNNTDINYMTSPITQYKGSAILRMLDHILGKDVFHDGVRRYLNAHKFGNVVTDDLWKAFQEVYDENYGSEKPLNIKETMDPWIEQTGTPIITVTRDYETGETNITQKNVRNANSDNKWRIPINYATKSNPDFSQTRPTMWMEKDEETKTIPNIDKDDWIILNIQQSGFYQVNYDKENWQRLAEYLIKDYEKIHPINRAQLIEDAHRMYKDDNTYIEALFNISYYLHEEIDPLPWIPVTKVIKNLHEKVRNTDVENFFQLYVLFITNKITDDIGFGKDDGYDPSSLRVRNMLAPIVCEYGNSDCQSFAKRQLNSYLENPTENAFPNSNWPWILCFGLKEANDTVWNKLMTDQLPLPEFMRESRYTLIKCAETKEQRDKYIGEAISPNSNATTDQITDMFKAFLGNDKSDVNYAMQYVIDHFDEIKTFYEKGDEVDLIILFGQTIFATKNQEQYDKMKAFYDPRKEEFKKVFGERAPSLEIVFANAEKMSKKEIESLTNSADY